jgi:hypothetical protein
VSRDRRKPQECRQFPRCNDTPSDPKEGISPGIIHTIEVRLRSCTRVAGTYEVVPRKPLSGAGWTSLLGSLTPCFGCVAGSKDLNPGAQLHAQVQHCTPRFKDTTPLKRALQDNFPATSASELLGMGPCRTQFHLIRGSPVLKLTHLRGSRRRIGISTSLSA